MSRAAKHDAEGAVCAVLMRTRVWQQFHPVEKHSHLEPGEDVPWGPDHPAYDEMGQ